MCKQSSWFEVVERWKASLCLCTIKITAMRWMFVDIPLLLHSWVVFYWKCLRHYKWSLVCWKQRKELQKKVFLVAVCKCHWWEKMFIFRVQFFKCLFFWLLQITFTIFLYCQLYCTVLYSDSKLWHISGFSQTPQVFPGTFSQISVFRSSHNFIIELKAGLWDGHDKTCWC